MKKIIVIIFIALILCIPQITATDIEETDNLNLSFGKSIEIHGKVQFTKQLNHIPIGEKTLIAYMSMNLIDGSEVTVKINNEIFNFDYAGTIKIIGFYGTYNDQEDTDKNDGKTDINLQGKAFYINIKGKQFEEVDESYAPIIESLNTITHPLDKSPLELSDEDLECLSYLSDCKIVGLGEATHATKEFFQLKHRIFKYLVENHDFKIFTFESEMSGTYYVDRFITKVEGDIEDIMKNHFPFPWPCEEVKSLLLWMKEYNEDKLDAEKIHLIGFDCQYLYDYADIILDTFNKANISLSEKHLQFLNKIDQIGRYTFYEYPKMSIEEIEEIDKGVNNLLDLINESKDTFISSLSEYEYQFIKRIALNIKHINAVVALYDPNDLTEFANLRDIYMAQNTLWASNLFGENTKIAAWAHNLHLANYDDFYPDGTMGFHLKQALNEQYQIVDFAFSFGNFIAMNTNNNFRKEICSITQEPLFGSMNYVFHHAQDKNFILREIDIQEGSDLDTWISEPQELLEIGATFNDNSHDWYFVTDFKNHFDALIYWDVTIASELLNTKNNPEDSIISPLFLE